MADFDKELKELAKAVMQLSPDELTKLDHASLYMARRQAPSTEQNRLAAPEHRAFTREATAENPLMAVPLAVATVGYQPYKMLVDGSRSGASIDQLMQGLAGIGEGLGVAGSKAADHVLKALKL